MFNSPLSLTGVMPQQFPLQHSNYADRFRTSHKHHGSHNTPNKPSTSGNVRKRLRSTRYDCHLSFTGTAPRLISLQKSNKTSVRMRLPTDFAHRTISIVAHMTYLISNPRAIACALGCVRLTLVTNTHGAKTDSTAKEQQNECENALVD